MRFFGLFKKKKVELTEAQLKLNKIWELWTEEKAESPYAELMTYQSEVNNGGHSQYFCNVENVGDLQKEMAELGRVLPFDLNENLQKAYQAHLILEKTEDEKAEEIMERCDDAFYENEQIINQLLEKYAEKTEL
ncbi:MAG: DMP19 family protein [Clostridia bacterium]|nr:DMP19 family protein [Clostridia bacterium]